MHVAQVSGFVDRQRRSPLQLLDAWPTLRQVAEAAADSGNRVTVIQPAAQDAVLQSNGVDYRFIRAASTRTSAPALIAATRAVRPDLVHFSGLGLPLHVWALRRALPNTPLLLQDHADRPVSGWRALARRALLRDVDGVAFTAPELAEPFRSAGLLLHARVYEVPECSSRFTPGDPQTARGQTGVYGNPCVVWVGRLNDVKDPLTALAAFSRALDHLPDARLWCAFGNAPLLYDVQRAIAADQRLAAAVTLLGSLPHARIETLLRAADIFLASSRREATGAALIEALACGATPVVTSIPAFRALTGNGTVGVLFRVGDAAAGADALVAAARRAGERGRVRAHFDEQYSLEALGRRLSRVYHELLQV
jgi:glycosyltransferase involved in cell wall biosynthesis